MKPIICSLLTMGALFAQSSETITFRTALSAANETTPVVDRNASGGVNVLLHVVRDAAGKVTSGSLDFQPSYRMSGATTFTAMHIHKAPANVAGAIVVPVPLLRFDDPTGVGVMEQKQVQFTSADTTILDSVNGLLDDPSQFYFNIHTADAPAGAMRGQLARVQETVLMGLMSPANENPPIQGSTASAVATVLGRRTVTAGGVTTSASVIFDINYTGFPADTTFTGLHIHLGNVGVNGGVTIDSGISAARPVTGAISGNLHYEFDVDLARVNALESVAAIFDRPDAIYINLHTLVNPGGAIRAQLHGTDHVIFSVNATPQEEVATPPLTLTANSQTKVHVYTLRNLDGTAPAGAILFDTNPRFAVASNFTGMHLHDGLAGANGPVTMDSRLAAFPILAENGAGNITRLVTMSTPAQVTSLNSLLQNPEKHYFNLHTQANGGGAVRAQLGSPFTPAVVTAAISSVSDITRTVGAPKALMSVYGLGLSKVSSNVDGFLQSDTLPKSINGTSVTVGGTQAGLLLVSPGQLILEVPAEATAGDQAIVVTSATGVSRPFQLPVLASSPNIFFDATGGVITKADYSLIRAGNPAAAGDVLLIFSTGNGQTTPPLNTARVPPTNQLFNAPAPTVTIGGQAAQVIYSVASPGFPGLYQTGVRMPTGVTGPRAAVRMTVGGTASNTVNIDVR